MATPKRFTAVNALVVSTKRDKKGGSARIKFELTSRVTKALDWPEMPEGTGEWCPDVDELVTSLIELTPNTPERAAYAITVAAEKIGDFMVSRKKKKVGNNAVKAAKVITEVACKITFSETDGCAKLEQYIQGAARSEMMVCYTPQPIQDELPGTQVDMSPESSQESLLAPEPEQPLPTHAEKVAARKDESERKRKLREVQ